MIRPCIGTEYWLLAADAGEDEVAAPLAPLLVALRLCEAPEDAEPVAEPVAEPEADADELEPPVPLSPPACTPIRVQVAEVDTANPDPCSRAWVR